MLVQEKLHSILTASFRFVVSIDNQPVGAFTECILPTIEWEMEQIKEGGLNTSVHQLPGPRKQATLTLKNGIGIVDDLLSWCMDTMNQKFKRRNVTVIMLNHMMMPIIAWHIQGALPMRWSAPQLQADSSTVAIQTLELACGEVSVEGGI
jgi:phage tail-like protein